MNNPANDLKDSMWDFLKDRKQEANITALKNAVYTLIGMTTQKDAGQRGKGIPFDILDMVKWQIICESVALVLSGKLDDLEEEHDSARTEEREAMGMLDAGQDS